MHFEVDRGNGGVSSVQRVLERRKSQIKRSIPIPGSLSVLLVHADMCLKKAKKFLPFAFYPLVSR